MIPRTRRFRRHYTIIGEDVGDIIVFTSPEPQLRRALGLPKPATSNPLAEEVRNVRTLLWRDPEAFVIWMAYLVWRDDLEHLEGGYVLLSDIEARLPEKAKSWLLS